MTTDMTDPYTKSRNLINGAKDNVTVGRAQVLALLAIADALEDLRETLADKETDQ